jgi:hypothetical protein
MQRARPGPALTSDQGFGTLHGAQMLARPAKHKLCYRSVFGKRSKITLGFPIPPHS